MNNTESNKELEAFLEASLPKIFVIGVGGSGNNTIERINSVGVEGANTIAINTDAQALIRVNADKKVLIGKKSTKGLGAGSNPDVGASAAEESKEELLEICKGSNLVFVTCGLGGGTGTGAAPVMAKISRESGALTIGVVTLPFAVEGKRRIDNALAGLEKLKKEVDTLIIIPNDKILEIAPDLPLNIAFQEVDKILTEAVKGIIELITKAGIINLDFADLKTILTKGGIAMIGVGESSVEKGNESRAMEAVENALTSPLLDVDISSSTRALVNVLGGNDLTLKEAEMIVETVASKINDEAHIIWGAMIDDNLAKKKVKVMVVIAGANIPYLDDDYEHSSNRDLDLEIDSV
ncbi:MAG: cell division protein FtsZ [archaeon]|nr:cell division protein FtsZ [archaeon]MDD2477880.1 cell division protein FtsZ [Candidatus ainarchaeum sp.]MDD3084425.1 cell division protein FtsZ [Candidatus ainarchaeum sp.]MDD4220887.1 cell division protein FtsZ [Candidatus ainarchaeum sp.]MDD4662688.1 cell division protein FtsZ [Candidatus ainarchaeum sp.]